MKTIDKCGIYQIVCSNTGKFYVGSSCQIYRRWSQHRLYLGRGVSVSIHLQNAWNKHGADAFEFSILEECDKAVLEEREQFYIDTLRPALNAVTSVKRRDSPEIRAKIATAVRARAALITHCPRGHIYDEANSYVGKKGERICRTCNAERVASIYEEETSAEREVRRQKVKVYQERTREERLVKQRGYTARTKEQKQEYDRLHRAESAKRRSEARATETPEQADARRAKKMAAHHKRLGRIDGKPPPREPMTEAQKAKISATLVEHNAANPKPRNEPWIEEGVSKTTWYRRQYRANETPDEAEARRAYKRDYYRANIESERAYMRARYRRKVDDRSPHEPCADLLSSQ